MGFQFFQRLGLNFQAPLLYTLIQSHSKPNHCALAITPTSHISILRVMFSDIHEGVYLQHPVLWISDTNSAFLCAQFEKSQTKRKTFLWKKSSPTHESLFNFKNWSGKCDESEKLIGEK